MKNNRQPEPKEVQPLLVRERVEVNEQDGLMKQYLDALLRHGGMFTQAQASRMLGVSTPRVAELVKKGQLPLVEVVLPLEGPHEALLETLIPGNALRQWRDRPKSKGGRGHRARPVTLDECVA